MTERGAVSRSLVLFGAAIVVALAAIVFGIVRSGQDPSPTTVAAATTTTTTTPPTTTTTTTTPPTTTTTTPPTTTTTTPPTTTTTTPPTTTSSAPATTTRPREVMFTDSFDGTAPEPVAMFGREFMIWDLVRGDRGRLRGLSSGVLPVVYEEVLGDVAITFRIRPLSAGDESGFGAVLRADDPADGELERYVLVAFRPGDQILVMAAFSNGEFVDLKTYSLPQPFVVGSYNDIGIVALGNEITVVLDDSDVATWTSPAVDALGRFGFAVVGTDEVEERMLVEDLVIRFP